MGQLFLLAFQGFQLAVYQVRLLQAFPAGVVVFLLVTGLRQPLLQLLQAAQLVFSFCERVPGTAAFLPQAGASGPEVQRLHAEGLVLEPQRLVLGVDIHQMGRQFLQYAYAHGFVVSE